jgi:hypothetical protein
LQEKGTEEAPEMITVQQTQMKVEQVFVNRKAAPADKSYWVACAKGDFEVYDDKLDLLFKGCIGGDAFS